MCRLVRTALVRIGDLPVSAPRLRFATARREGKAHVAFDRRGRVVVTRRGGSIGSSAGMSRPATRTPRDRKRVAPRSMVSDSAIGYATRQMRPPATSAPTLSQGRFDDLVS